MTVESEHLGCSTCWPEDAADALKSVSGLKMGATLIGESHFSIKLRSCPGCKQRFLSVFTETIDWVDGEDPQFLNVLPVTEAESKQLLEKEEVIESLSPSFAPDRRSLCNDWPKGENAKTYWCQGLTIRAHD